MSTIDREAISELFSAFGSVVVKSMFGGAGIYADGIFFALVDDGVIYLKADDETRPRFEAEGCTQFVYEGKTREVAMSYWRMPTRLYDDPGELAEWARQALGAARRAAARKSTPKRSKAAKGNSSSTAKTKKPAKRRASANLAKKSKVRRRARSSGGTRSRVRR